MYRRNIGVRVDAALSDTRVILLHGPRQAGKSTLARATADARGGRYVTLDDEAAIAAARSDPAAFVSGAKGLLVIDEVQRAPSLFPAIKIAVDQDPRPGRFLLTGSTNVFLVPTVSESLAGRMEVLSLLPLSQDELAGRSASLPDLLFSGDPSDAPSIASDRVEVCARMIAGGFPEAVGRDLGDRKAAWYRGYLTSILQRDVRDLSNIEGLADLPRLLSLLAARTAALLNMSELSRAMQIAHTTLRRYLTLLEATFLFAPLPPWSTNLGKRLVRSPKVHLVDSGLAAHLRGETDAAALSRSDGFGHLLESFVLQQIRTQLAWSRTSAMPYHFRTPAGREVDIVLEATGGRTIGIEVKATSSVDRSDFAGLKALAEEAGDRFTCGVVLHLGPNALPFGDRLWALPIGVLWEG